MQVKLRICADCGKPKPVWKREANLPICKVCWGRRKPTVLPRPTKAIPFESPKRKKEHVDYSRDRKIFLDKNSVCKMAISGLCTVKSTDIQHLRGRGKYYLDQNYWMAACRACHQYATDHPQEAIENGWALPRIP